MRKSFHIAIPLLALCLFCTHSALAQKRAPKKSAAAASQEKKPAASPSKVAAPAQPSQADQLRRLQQLVHQPVANE